MEPTPGQELNRSHSNQEVDDEIANTRHRREDTTKHGRIDMTVRLENRAFTFEFKVVDFDKTPGTALE